MIFPPLYKQPVALDKVRHGRLKMRMDRLIDWERLAAIRCCYLHVSEFADACIDFPIGFFQMEPDPETGPAEILPMAVLGFKEHENLHVEGSTWRTSYVPACFRAWPFGVVTNADGTRHAVLDESCPGLDEQQGTPLYDDQGEPSTYTRESVNFAEKVYSEIRLTRMACARLMELQVLQLWRFSVEDIAGGPIDARFFSTDESKVQALSDAQVLELHRTGLLKLVHAQHLSVRRLWDMARWHARRHANA
jgi:hypothetical protein